MSPEIPEELRGIYHPEEYAKQQDYQKTNSRFGLISGGFSFLIVSGILLFGVLGWFDEFLRGYTDSFIFLPLLFFGIFFFAGEVIDLPFDWYGTFTIEEKFGFNKSTRKLFVWDAFKGLLLSMFLGGIILTAVIYIYQYTGEGFWLWAWLVVSGFSLIMSLFYSEWIVPLFNKQTPLEAGELRNAIEVFAQQAGFELNNIYVMDGSKRSTKANAYFTGMGKKKRIVLFDTLINDLETNEIVAVLAHEIGHYKKKHVIQSLVMSIISSGIIFYILSLFLGNLALAEALGGKTASFHLGLIGFSFLFTPVSEISGLLFGAISRKNEYQADNYAAQFGLGNALISALKKLSVKSLNNLNPHPWVVFWYYSHPTLLQRIESIALQPPSPLVGGWGAFSICIPIYNFDVGELVRSLQEQAVKTGLPFEILLMDDASSMEYRKLNATIDLPGVRYIQLSQNVGRSKIRNQLSREAKYPYLIFMDCDSAVPSTDYINRYIPYFEPETICYGGRMYEDKRPDDEKYLRWKYGRKRECIPAVQRDINPNYGFEANNFLIDKLLFEKVRFDETLQGYGHEDTLFGIQLLGEGIIIRHIDNPLVHIGLEDTETFLRKTESGVSNLQKIAEILRANYPEYAGHSRLVRLKKSLDKWKLTAVAAFALSWFQPLIKKNLSGKHPSLFCFDLYKLGVLCGTKSISHQPA
jgi:STE24 endopeptidase